MTPLRLLLRLILLEPDASMFQMNASLMGGSPNGQGASWITNSDVVHAVSKTPGGPYAAADIALGPRGNVVRNSSCSYVPGLPAKVCPVVEADEFWDAATTHTPAVQRDPISGYYLIYYMGTMQKYVRMPAVSACCNLCC